MDSLSFLQNITGTFDNALSEGQTGATVITNPVCNFLPWRYVVGITNFIFPLEFFKKNMALCVRFATERNDKYDAIGFWIEPGTDNVYLDLSFIYCDMDSAIYSARKFGQKAIFDLKDKREIFING